ncbi:MAG: tandem-95 repeat protein, partial [Bradyrhizobium icense]
VHSPNTGPDQSTSLSAANLITLTATITDKDGDSASAVQNIGTSLVFKDDAPTAPSLSPAVAGVAHDETVGVQTSADPNAAQDVAANSAGFGSFATVADIFTAVPTQGDDLDVAGTGPIGYAASAGSLVTLSGGSFGNDGAAASNSTTYALVVTDGAPSGVSTTGGTQIFLYNGGNGLILGRVGTEAGATDTANASGTVAFALATDPATGKVYVAQYLSLAHGTAGSNAAAYDESISLTLASLGMKVTYTDKDGDAATSTTVNIGNLVSFQDDGPSAGNDTIGTAITGTFTTGNLLSNDSYGVDGAASTGSVTATNGAHGTVVYNNNGTFTYTPNAGYNGSDSFTYIIKDGDGDTSTATVTLQSIQTNTLPTAGTQSITVDEDGLTNGITASQPGDVAGAAITQTGTLVFNFNADGPAATDPINFSPMHNTSVGLSSGGAALTYYWDSTGDTLYASTNTSSLANAQSSAVFKVVLNTTTGVYTFTELKPVDHPGHDADGLNNGPETSYEDNVVVNLTYQVKDSNGDAATGTLAVTINDDSPTAAPDTGSANEKVAQTIHAAFVLDFSGSIDSTEFAQMMTAVKAAGDKIFQNSTGGTSVELVAFASSSIASGPFLTQAAFDAQMDAWTSSRPLSSNTNYTSAISTLLANYSSVAGQNNQVFFVSDGNPNEGTGSGGDVLSEPTKTNWSNFVNGATQVHVTSIGVGDGIDNASLQQIDVDGQGTVIAVAQFSDLIDTITALIGTDATGNVLTNDGFGADGGRLLSITIDNVEYTFNGTNHVTATSGSAPASFVDHGTWMEVGTQLQGKITFYFATTGSHQAGEWNYSAPNELAADTSENISYAIRDNDGDKVTSTLTISVLAQNDAPVISLNTTPVTLHATDNFAAQSYSGGSGWAGNWTETNEFTGTNPTADDIQIVADGSGNFSLRLSDDIGDSDSENPGDTVQRTVNLTGATSATLEFDYKRSNMTGSDDQVFVQVSKDGVNYTTVLTIDQNSPTSSTHFSVDISAYISSGTSIRFVAPDGLEADDFAFVDNIDVSYSVPGHVAYTENAAAVKIMPAATLADPDNPSNFNGGSLHVQLTAGSVAGDALAFTGVGATQSSGNVIVGGTTIGTVTGYGTADMTISFNTNATDARIETLMQAIGFSSTSDNPGTSRTVTVTFNDGGNTGAGGPLSDVKTVTIDVTQINDAPVANNDTGQATEAGGTANGTAGSNATGNVLTNDTDPDSTLTVASFRTGGTEGSGTAGVVGGAALTGAHGTLTLGANGAYTYAVNENDAAVQALNVGGTTTDTFNYTVTDGSSTDIATLTITINGANDAPTTDLNGGTAGTNSSAA